MKIRKLIPAFVALGLCLSATALRAEVPTEITEITTNASTVFTTVKGIVIGVVGFGVLLFFVKMIRRK